MGVKPGIQPVRRPNVRAAMGRVVQRRNLLMGAELGSRGSRRADACTRGTGPTSARRPASRCDPFKSLNTHLVIFETTLWCVLSLLSSFLSRADASVRVLCSGDCRVDHVGRPWTGSIVHEADESLDVRGVRAREWPYIRAGL